MPGGQGLVVQELLYSITNHRSSFDKMSIVAAAKRFYNETDVTEARRVLVDQLTSLNTEPPTMPGVRRGSNTKSKMEKELEDICDLLQAAEERTLSLPTFVSCELSKVMALSAPLNDEGPISDLAQSQLRALEGISALQNTMAVILQTVQQQQLSQPLGSSSNSKPERPLSSRLYSDTCKAQEAAPGADPSGAASSAGAPANRASGSTAPAGGAPACGQLAAASPASNAESKAPVHRGKHVARYDPRTTTRSKPRLVVRDGCSKLIIGDSQVKRILSNRLDVRGHTQIWSRPGGTLDSVTHELMDASAQGQALSNQVTEVLLFLGGNDLSVRNGCSAESFVERLRTLKALVGQLFPASKIRFLEALPRTDLAAPDALEQTRKLIDTTFGLGFLVPHGIQAAHISGDGVHLNETGLALLVDKLVDLLQLEPSDKPVF